MFAYTLGDETLLQGCAQKQYDSLLRPTRFAAPEALLSRVALLFQRFFPFAK